jgi:hypothetical protein
MDQAGRNASACEIERRLLAALCAPGLDEETRAQLFERLATHKFAGADHETIFRALLKMRAAPAWHIRETLGACLTRLGFPDIDVDPIFTLEPPSAEQIAAFLDRLTP